jgi:ubiquinone/menaquinone biosynthesis C-methylase UbiE
MEATDGEVFLDLGCGVGTTCRLLSEQFGCKVVGMDLSPGNARDSLHRTEQHDGISFLAADGQHVPVMERTFDGVMLECVLSTFHDKPAAVGELVRVLKPKGRLGMSDIVVEGDVSEELRSPLMDALCVGRALSTNGYLSLLEQGGFNVTGVRKAKQETLDFLEQIRRQLFLAKLLAGVGKLGLDLQDLDYVRHLLSLAGEAVKQDKLGYVVIAGRKSD